MNYWIYPKLIGGYANGRKVVEGHFNDSLIKIAVPPQGYGLDEHIHYFRFHTEDYFRHEFGYIDGGVLLFFAHKELTQEAAGKLLWYEIMQALGARPYER